MAEVVKFVQEVCPKCDVLEQMLDAMGKEPDKVVLISDDNRAEVKEKYDIMGTPTLIAFNGEGEELLRTSSIAYGQVEEFFNEVGK